MTQLVRQFRPAGAVLDVGCGVGFLVCELLAAGYDAYGCDIALSMVRRARERVAARHLGGEERFRPCSASRLPFERTFDAVTAIGVFEYARDCGEFLGLLGRHLVPGGVLVASCLNRRALYVFAEMSRHLASFRRGGEWRAVWRNLWRTGLWSGGYQDEPVVRRCTNATSFERLLVEHGYTLLARIDLYQLGGRWLDRDPRRRTGLGRLLARWAGWTHLVVARRGDAGD